MVNESRLSLSPYPVCQDVSIYLRGLWYEERGMKKVLGRIVRSVNKENAAGRLCVHFP